MKHDNKALRAAQQRVVEAIARHTAYLHRAATAQANDISEAVTELGDQLAGMISERLEGLAPAELQAFAQGRYHTDRLKGLKKAIDRWGDELEAKIYQLTLPGFEELAGHEAEYARSLLANSLEDADLPAAPTAAAAFAAAQGQPIMGELMEDLAAGIPERTRRQVYSTIRQGIAEGQTSQQIVRALRGTRALNYKDGVLQITRTAAERMVRTGRSHVSNVSYEETYRVLGVDEVVWTSTLDGRTTLICSSRDGQRYEVGTDHPRPPAHYQCRSVLAPSFNGDIMGKRPYVRAFKPVGQIPKGDRTKDMVGQVSAKTTYADWFARQPAGFQKEWLGPSRYRLYREGGYKLDRFIDPLGNKLTLEELRQRDRDTFRELFD
tara:strand:- start:1406 stop:2542 length:1137 start_codon:yes stop_codon:yes gene_type:complete